jgi:dienelactone hydrolase
VSLLSEYRRKAKSASTLSLLLAALLAATRILPAEVASPLESSPELFAVGAFVEGIACENDPSQTYTLYLPTAYEKVGEYPVLFIFDPRGRSVRAAELFRAAAERYGWILLSSDNTRSDGPWEPNIRAVSAMWPELKRFAYDPRRIYAAGFSGGAMVAWSLGEGTKALAGVISSGSRPRDAASPSVEVPFAHFGAAGAAEFNYRPTRELDSIAAAAGAPHRFESFPGPHAWMPPEIALESVEWMEIQAMRAQTRPLDDSLVEELFEKDKAKAEALESAGKILEAQRRYAAIARTFDGLLDLEKVEQKALSLEASSQFKQERKRERDAFSYEQILRTNTARAIKHLKNSDRPLGANRLANELRLSAMQRTAREDSYKGMAAQRALNSLQSFLAFYLPRDLLAEKDFGRAAVVLELATQITPNRPIVWYNLACSCAQIGQTEKAMAALGRAVDVGYRNPDYLDTDSDMDPLRNQPGFTEIVQRLRQSAGSPGQ